jgi:hypothetical protein
VTLTKKILVTVVMTFISLTCFYVSYLPTLTMDLFPWGDSTRDGLYLLIVPIFLIPLILVLSLIKWTLLRKLALPSYIKFSWTLLIWLGLTVIFPLIAGGQWIIVIPSFIIGVVYFIELLRILYWTDYNLLDNTHQGTTVH